jgi:hypothetical protein
MSLNQNTCGTTGSRGCCAEYNMIPNIFCIVCKKWLCDPQSAANQALTVSEDNECIEIKFYDGALTGTETSICAIFSC